jgi:acyl dehydratase
MAQADTGQPSLLHVKMYFAQRAGMPDVFAHGMLSMAYLGRMLTNWQPEARLRSFSSRFAAITQLHDTITCSGRVTALLEQGGETLAQCAIQAVNVNGEKTLVGEALVAL